MLDEEYIFGGAMFKDVFSSFIVNVLTNLFTQKRSYYLRVSQILLYVGLVIVARAIFKFPVVSLLESRWIYFWLFGAMLIILLVPRMTKIKVGDFPVSVFDELIRSKNVIEIASRTTVFKKEWISILISSVFFMASVALVIVHLLGRVLELDSFYGLSIIVAASLLLVYETSPADIKDFLIYLLILPFYPLPFFIDIPKKHAVNNLKLWEFYYLLTINGGKEIKKYEIVNIPDYYRGFMIIGENIISYVVNGDNVVVEELYNNKPIFYNSSLRIFKFLITRDCIEKIPEINEKYSMMNDIFFVKKRGDHAHLIYIRPINFNLYYLYDVTEDDSPVIKVNVKKETHRMGNFINIWQQHNFFAYKVECEIKESQ